MKTRHYHRLLKPLVVMMAMLAASCSSDVATDSEESLPDGMGRISITICTPESNPDITRAVNATPWENPDHDWEKLHSFRILLFKKGTGTSVTLEDIIERTDPVMTASSPDPSYQQFTVTSDAISTGTYIIYATANCHKSVNANDVCDDGFVKGNTYTIAEIDALTLKLVNGYSEKNIPMSGKLTTAPGGSTLKEITVTAGTTPAGTITVWRMLGKLDFKFINETSGKIQIKGIEVEPINQASIVDGTHGIFLFSQNDLTSTENLPSGTSGITLPSAARTDVGKVKYTASTALELEAKNAGDTDEGNLFFYVNETDATYTTTNNQLSVRFKIARQKGSGWYADEIRYGLTTNYAGSSGGFNVIRRNDWIHIPVHLRDWQFRIEALPFVPIAGYPAVLLSSDALSATFKTGGYIILKPFAQKNNDGLWRDFFDPEVTYESLSWQNSDGTNQSGTGKIVKTPFTYDTVNKCITGELNNTLSGTHKTTVTVNVKLGPTGDQQDYSFTFNVILDK